MAHLLFKGLFIQPGKYIQIASTSESHGTNNARSVGIGESLVSRVHCRTSTLFEPHTLVVALVWFGVEVQPTPLLGLENFRRAPKAIVSL